MYNNKINTKKLKPGSVTSYNIRTVHGEGIFWFQHFINLSLTYKKILTHLLTALGPTQDRFSRIVVTLYNSDH